MLLELHVRDFAIIDSLHLCFGEGLNILSGETGAGKSIIVGALGLLLGSRASSDMIRSEKNEAVVEAVFSIDDNESVARVLVTQGIDTQNGQIVIRRTISRAGKNKILIGRQIATTQMLAQVGGHLLDISGQYSQQLLLQAEKHIEILDAFAGISALQADYQSCFSAYQDKSSALRGLVRTSERMEQHRELLQFQQAEIANARLEAEEEPALLQERTILQNAQTLFENTYSVYAAIYEDDQAFVPGLKALLRRIENAAHIDTALQQYLESMESAVINLEDVALSLRSYAENITVDQQRLETIESRLDELRRLKKKYGGSVEEILALYQQIGQELAGLEGSSSRIDILRAELAADADELWNLARKLSGARAEAARMFERKVERELRSIGMQKAHFQTAIRSISRPDDDPSGHSIAGLTPTGMDSVEFFIAPNRGEELKPLSRIASGGEISRIVLAIKRILAQDYHVPTLLFDEVDAGIGGAVAEAVGEKLKQMAGTHQVLCITHLPQIACYAESHYSVHKSFRHGRTVTCVEELDNGTRVEELARMLGGKKISDKTRAHAREMLKNARCN